MITIPSWSIPLIMTIIFMIIAIRSGPESSGDYDFGSSFVALLCLAGGVIASLILWVIYFAMKSGGHA